MRRLIKNLILIGLITAIGWYGYGYFTGKGGLMGGGPPGGAAPVSVAEVIVREVQQWHEFSGRLVAVEQAEVRPQVSGIIDKVHFKDGAMMKKGDMLFTIDPRPFEAALAAAQARATLAEAEMKRAQILIAEKAIPQRDYDQRKNDVAVARADLAAARLNLDYTRIKSPIDGRVSRAEITEGNLVQSGGSAPLLTTVVSSDPIYADFEVDENTFRQYVAAGISGNANAGKVPVKLALSEDGKAMLAGHIESFDNRINPSSGTIRVRAVFENDSGALVPGLFARVQLGSAGTNRAVLITDRAVGTDQNRKFVLVVGAENKTEHREVKLGGQAEGLRIVQDGLKPGDKIIVSGMQRVMMPGQPVTPEMVPMEGEAPAAGGKAPDKAGAGH